MRVIAKQEYPQNSALRSVAKLHDVYGGHRHARFDPWRPLEDSRTLAAAPFVTTVPGDETVRGDHMTAEGPEAQLAQFVDKFSPANQAAIRGVRDALEARLPGAHELVYDNYNFFVIGYCTTEKPSDCIVALVASRKGVSLSFYRGAELSDPDGLLQGAGSQNRFIRLADPLMLSNPSVEALIGEAVARARTPLATGHQGRLIIRSISAKQRRRR